MLRSKRNVKRASHSDGYRCSHYRETITNDERFGNAFTCAELDCDGFHEQLRDLYFSLGIQRLSATFMSIPHGQSGTGADTTHPNRKITLEVNDRAPISNGSSYTTPDFRNGKISGSATYRLRGVTLVPDPYFSPNTATGTFVLDASGTANPYTSN